MEYSRLQDKCRGSLVGGAVGDALGYEVEFLSLAAIRKRFGGQGITRYVTGADGVALFSDDTQMSLFTLEGLMNGVIATEAGRPDAILPYVRRAYLAWYRTQMSSPAPLAESWLSRLRTLWSRRAPGLTCMGALENLDRGHEVYNSSKGCGGVMRVAPVGIFSGAHPNLYSDADTARLAGEAAAVTHKHPASTLASALWRLTEISAGRNSGSLWTVVSTACAMFFRSIPTNCCLLRPSSAVLSVWPKAICRRPTPYASWVKDGSVMKLSP